MPVIVLESNCVDPRVTRRFARGVGRWLQGRGVPLAHSVVQCRRLDAADVYSGPFPFTRLVPPDEPAPLFAFVTCRVSRDRDLAFCRALAAEIAALLVPPLHRDYVFIAVDPVDARRHWRGCDVFDQATETITEQEEPA